MAMIVMVDKEAYEKGIETEPERFYIYQKPDNDGKGGIYCRKDYIGKVVRDIEHNGYDDSDFDVIVWEEKDKSFRRLEYATTRCWCYPCFATSVDATPEISELYKKHLVAERAKVEISAHLRQSEIPQQGREIVFKEKYRNKLLGRTIEKGEKAFASSGCFEGTYGIICKIQIDNRVILVPAHKVTVANPEAYEDKAYLEGLEKLIEDYETTREKF